MSRAEIQLPAVAGTARDPERACTSCGGREFRIGSDGPYRAYLSCSRCGTRRVVNDAVAGVEDAGAVADDQVAREVARVEAMDDQGFRRELADCMARCRRRDPGSQDQLAAAYLARLDRPVVVIRDAVAKGPRMSETGNIGAAARLGGPGPCTPRAHCWDDGNLWCNCGQAPRAERAGWRVASKLTNAEIAALIGGRP